MPVNEADRPKAPVENRDERNYVHVHTYNAETNVADGHQHVITGITAPARMEGRSHVHRIRIRTSFVDGHWHWFDVVTDIASNVPGDQHTHYFAGVTSVDDGHSHSVTGITGLAPNVDICANPWPAYKKRPDEE